MNFDFVKISAGHELITYQCELMMTHTLYIKKQIYKSTGILEIGTMLAFLF